MIPVGKIAKKNSLKSAFLFIWHSKYTAILLSKIHSFRLFFGDFVHWDGSRVRIIFTKVQLFLQKTKFFRK